MEKNDRRIIVKITPAAVLLLVVLIMAALLFLRGNRKE